MAENSSNPKAESSEQAKSAVRPRATPRLRAGLQRKSKAEREEYARKEAERAQERDAAEAKKDAAASRGRGASRGARGDRSSAFTSRSRGPTTGVFAGGIGSAPSRTKTVDLGISEAIGGGIGGTSLPQLQGQTEGSSKTSGPGGGRGDGGATGGRSLGKDTDDVSLEIEHDDERPRRDIERIWISSDEEEDVVTGRKDKQRRVSRTPRPKVSVAPRPVRAARTVLETEEHDLRKKGRAIPKKVQSKEDVAILEISSEEMQVEGEASKTTQSRRKSMRKSFSKEQKDAGIINETVEEKAERSRLNEDTVKMRHELLPQPRSDSDETLDSKEATFEQTKRRKMFLFQLPPLVPQLHDPSIPRLPPAERANGEPSDTKIKAEPGAVDGSVPQTAGIPSIFTASSPASQRAPSGFVGKLNVHKSGRVTLDWGGTAMEVRYGTEVDFLQDIVMVEPPAEPVSDAIDDGKPRERVGKARAMGQIRQKMICIPDWNTLYA